MQRSVHGCEHRRGLAPSTGAADGPVSVVGTTRPDAATVAAWDDLVVEAPYSDVTQLAAWARLRRAAGFRPFYVLAYRDGRELVGGAQVLERRIPLVGRIGYVSNGPVISADAPARGDIRRALATACHNLGRRRLRMLFIQPAEGADDMGRELLLRGFRPSDADIAPAASLRIDLSPSEAKIRAGLNKALRKWTNRWPERGVRVRLCGEGDIPVLADLLARSAEFQGFDPPSLAYLQTMYRELAPGGHAVLFIAEVDGVPVAANVYTGCGGALRSRLTGLDRSSDVLRLKVPSALMWEAMRWAKANGYRWFDFGGLGEVAVRLLEAGDSADSPVVGGADRFKMNFGGTAFRYPPALELIRSPVLRGAYDLSRRFTIGRRLARKAIALLRRGELRRPSPGSHVALIG